MFQQVQPTEKLGLELTIWTARSVAGPTEMSVWKRRSVLEVTEMNVWMPHTAPGVNEMSILMCHSVREAIEVSIWMCRSVREAIEVSMWMCRSVPGVTPTTHKAVPEAREALPMGWQVGIRALLMRFQRDMSMVLVYTKRSVACPADWQLFQRQPQDLGVKPRQLVASVQDCRQHIMPWQGG